MLTQFLNMIGTATDVRSVAAIVLGVLTTVLGHNSVVVKAVVDGVAGLIVLVDTYESHKTKQAAVAAAAAAHATAAAPRPTVSAPPTAG
ncbi:MAG: hypothetical protein M0Z46_19910 [Actinomycetota bacterium]|nr:hypothetical protein [Actinomycetota bacterium]